MPTKGKNSDPETSFYSDIADLIYFENAGYKTNWSIYPFEYQELFAEWRNTELKIKEMREEQNNELLKEIFKAVPRFK